MSEPRDYFIGFVERKIAVAMALSRGDCGGSYAEAYILLASLLSGMAADAWPGEGIDRCRFVELWVKFADPDLDATRVSVPLLIHYLCDHGEQAQADTLLRLRPDAEDSPLVIGRSDVDLPDSEVTKCCQGLGREVIRDFSYPAVFYRHVRSPLVHEFDLDSRVSSAPMSWVDEGVSYANPVEPPRRQIYFRPDWVGDVVRSIGRSGADSVLNGPHPHPQRWWVNH